MLATDDILEARGKTHGDFREQFRTSQFLKTALDVDDISDPVVREGLEMLCLKLSRIGAGDETEIDHYRDIAGYATLIARHLEETGQ